MKKIIINFKGVLLGTLLVVCLCSCGKDTAYYVEQSSESEVSEQTVVDDSDILEQEDGIYVYVCGQIKNAGVYVLPEGSRVCDLFAMAGGFTEKAAKDYWNQAKLLKDGEMIYVPTKEEVKDRTFDGKTNAFTGTGDSDKVNINTASKEELMTIPGIGASKATAIISYRQEHGQFSSIEEVKNVEGIKDGVYSKMKDFIEI